MKDEGTWPASLPIFKGEWSATPESAHRRSGEGLNELARIARRRQDFGLPDLVDVESGARVRVRGVADRPLGTVQECFANGTFAVRVDPNSRDSRTAAFVLLTASEFELVGPPGQDSTELRS